MLKFNLGKIYISKEQLYVMYLCFLYMPMMKPEYFEYVPIADLIFNVWRILVFFLMFISIFLIKKRISIVTSIVICLYSWLCLISLVKTGSMYFCLKRYFPILSVLLIYDIFSGRIKEIVEAQMLCFELLIYINLASIIFFPNGIYSTYHSVNYFLGYYNNFSGYFFPAFVIACLYTYYTSKKLRSVILVLAILISSILTWSGGVLLGLVAMIMVYMGGKNITTIFNFFSYWLIQPAFFLFVILMHIQNLFKWIINDILDKWVSLLMRMDLWEWYMKQIQKDFIIGHGTISPLIRDFMYSGWRAGHAHNQILEIMFEGGLIYFCCFIVIIVLCGKKIMPYKETEYVKIVSIGFLGWNIQCMVEPLMLPFLMGLFMLAFYSPNGIKSKI